MKIRRIATRFALLLGIAAVLPLVVYGFISIFSLQRGTRESVINGNQNVAVRAAEEVGFTLEESAEGVRLRPPVADTPDRERNRERLSGELDQLEHEAGQLRGQDLPGLDQ